mmetsp:Transcript_3850/g.6036  ORF Transcript_3850/g.6036 Transcript_3850/m.6036 type:complete len:173 (+) Transcript_3850:78-596(+)
MLATFILKLILLIYASASKAWSPNVPFTSFTHMGKPNCSTKSQLQITEKFEDLMEMDIVLFSREEDDRTELGAMQEDGTVAPLSAWTLEPAYGSSLEFVVDEENRFPGLTGNDIKILSILDETMIGYGSRQVGGGKGPGNPHGEECETVYYVESEALDEVDLVVNPELLIDW